MRIRNSDTICYHTCVEAVRSEGKGEHDLRLGCTEPVQVLQAEPGSPLVATAVTAAASRRLLHHSAVRDQGQQVHNPA